VKQDNYCITKKGKGEGERGKGKYTNVLFPKSYEAPIFKYGE
jgi:hypothetical protein